MTTTINNNPTDPTSPLPCPPIHKEAKFVVLSDWDGTITLFDSNDYLIDNYGFGKDVRRAYNVKTRRGEMNFRDAFYAELKSIHETSKLTFDQCVEILTKESRLDPGFALFFNWCKSNDVPVVIVSSGMEPLIRAVLSKLIGAEGAAEIDIIANGVKVENDGTWEIQFRHPESGFGHDKSTAMLPYRQLPEPPVLFFFGDGVSDLSAAAHTDLLFAKRKVDGESDLAQYCDEKGIGYVPFKDFDEALPIVQGVVRGELSVEQALRRREL